MQCIEIIERNCITKTKFLCEPHLSDNKYKDNSNYTKLIQEEREYKRRKVANSAEGMRIPAIARKKMLDLISYSDGKNTLLDIAEKCNLPIWNLYSIVDWLENKKIIKKYNF